MDHIRLLLDIGELNWVFKDSSDIETLLQNIVKMVARHMKADVCSIYFFEEKKQELVLRANVGLNPASIGKIKMKLGEGIAGACLVSMEPICTDDILTHPDFKSFPGTNEELYKVFLAMPIVNGNSRVGVLVLQKKEKYRFLENDILALRVITSQLATLIENVRLMTTMDHYLKQISDTNLKPSFEAMFIKGKPASRGYAYGKVSVIEKNRGFSDLEKMSFKKYSLKDFVRALGETELQIEVLQKQVEKNLTDAASMIFTSHLLILKDKTFIRSITENIKKGKNPPEAVMFVANKYVNIFLASSNEYIREKSKDIEDLVVRIISNIIKDRVKLPGVKGRIVVAQEMYPSDVLMISSEKIKGVVLISGGVTSHVSILSRSLGIPMVIVNEPALLNISRDAKILIDAEIGNIFINPRNDVLKEFKDKLKKKTKAIPTGVLPQTKTQDGLRVQLMANVSLLKDIDTLKDLPCDGIGLYRSEFTFLIRSNFPSEEEQYFVYKKLVDGMPDKEITFRTLDVGGDKNLSYSQRTRRDNTILGLRSIRFSLKNREIFSEQIRAILRAGYNAKLRIMFPMIFSIEEFITAKKVVQTCQEQLEKQKIPHNNSPQIGMMVEIPAVIEIIGEFAKLVDFFSIGTNDLIQYMLAVDRNNEEVADYYLPHHPSILRAIKRAADAAIANNIDISVCGDMSNSAKYISFMIGIGIKKFSMNPEYLYENQKAIASLNSKYSRDMAKKIIGLSNINDIEKVLFG
jgi:phosphotransferase system, enzyme I, PtsP